MFTGLVETVGTVRAATGENPRRLTLASAIDAKDTAIGDSVAIDGCCLTVVAKGDDTLTFEAATETLEVTTLGALTAGDRVNLERALRMGDRLGGHLVLGHVDGVGTVTALERKGSALYVGVDAPDEVARLTAKRGSITLAGVSLTVTEVAGNTFYVGLIPHTLDVTNFDALAVGQRLNLEADVMARYVERLLTFGDGENAVKSAPSLTVEFLKDKGFA